MGVRKKSHSQFALLDILCMTVGFFAGIFIRHGELNIMNIYSVYEEVYGVLIFAIIAIPLSMVNPRQGKFARLGPAIILFVCYYLALIGMRNIVNSGKIPIYPGLYLVPIVFFIFVAVPLNIERKRGGKKKKALVKNK